MVRSGDAGGRRTPIGKVTMSFLDWLTGGTFDANRDEADRLFAQKEWGEARLVYQRALRKRKDADAGAVERVEKRVDECLRELAKIRLATARRYLANGDKEAALECLEDAAQIHGGADTAADIESLKEEVEGAASTDQAHELDEEELMAIISGTWSVPQAEEFADLPPAFMEGLMAAHDGRMAEAASLLEPVVARTPGCRFARFELGRMQIAAGRTEEGIRSIDAFLSAVADDGDALDERVAAHTVMAKVRMDEGDSRAAEEHLMAAFRAAPDNHVPMLNLGVFLREKGELERAKKALRNAMDTMGSVHPDMRVMREMGLTCLAAGERSEGIGYLEACLESCCRTGSHDQYDPEAAVPLARLYEEDGELTKASDIFRHLAAGGHTGGHFVYHLESARLLLARKADGELVRRYLDRAAALARTSEERQGVEHLCEQIGTS
jgi:Tfp pilus assembly protein PilF